MGLRPWGAGAGAGLLPVALAVLLILFLHGTGQADALAKTLADAPREAAKAAALAALADGQAAPLPSPVPNAVPNTLADPPAEIRELWTGKLYSSTFRAGLCMPGQGDGDIRGVLLLRLSSGQVDVYHFSGRTEGGKIRLRHPPSGHSFKGQLDNAAEVSGEIRLKSGFTVQLTGQRQGDAELSADTCRPL